MLKRCIAFFVSFYLVIALNAEANKCYKLKSEPLENNFVLVIDKSGSMKGNPLDNAKVGAKSFVKSIWSNDNTSILTFSDNVDVVSNFSNNKYALERKIDRINSGGQTVLYDAITKAISLLRNRSGSKIIVFLTDGADNRSRYSISEVRSMNISEGIFVYGIGLGNVSENKLRKLTRATNGFLELTANSRDLTNLYTKIIKKYYDTYGKKQKANGKITIKSIPDKVPIIFDGKYVGETPAKLDNIVPGKHNVTVEFNRGDAKCDFPVKSGFRTIIDLREDDLGRDISIASNIPDCNVFIDSIFVGSTSKYPIMISRNNWIQKFKNDSRQLKINRVPFGRHIIRIKGIPDFDFGPDQEKEIEMLITKSDPVHIFLFVPLISRSHEVKTNAKNYKVINNQKDPFEDFLNR